MLLVAPLVAALLLGACGSSGGSSNTSSGPKVPPAIYTAVPLSPLSTELLDAYKQEHPETKLTVKAGNQINLTQIITTKYPGVAVVPTTWIPPDLASGGKVYGHNEVELAVPAASATVTNLASYGRTPNARKAQCVVYVQVAPCRATALQQVASKQLDVAVVWRGGFTPPAGVKILSIPASQNAIIEQSFVVLGDTDEAKSFGDFMTSDTAKKILTAQGLLP